MTRLPVWIQQLTPYEPGRPISEVARELGIEDPDTIVKLASNENALGPSRKALAAARAALRTAHRYPEGSSHDLRHALARHLQLDPDQIAIGHGSNELIALIGHVFLEPGADIVVADRAFVIYRLVADLFRARTIAVPMRDFTHDLDAMARAVTPHTRLVFVANPNNPTGTMVGRAEIERFMDQVPPHVWVVWDEAYIELLPPPMQAATLRYVREQRRVFVLRSFSKTYGLAGLRIGYAAAPADAIDALNRVRQPFNVNAIAQAAALAALEDREHVERTRRMVANGLRQLERGFQQLGLEYVPSVANFILVRVGAGRQVFQQLLSRGVIVRPMDAYGLPEYVRVTVGTRAENRRFLRALADLRSEGVIP